MPDQVASLLPPGAGRFQDFVWPDLTTAFNNGTSAAHRPRTSGAAAAAGFVANQGGGIANAAAVWDGVPCQQIISSAVPAGSQRIFYPGFPLGVRTSRSNIDGRTDDLSVFRLVCNMAIQGNAQPTGDFGFGFCQYLGPTLSTIITNGNVGVIVHIADNNTVDLGFNGPHGLQAQTLTSAPFDTTQFHSYDLRVFSATATADAYVTMRIDGVPQHLNQDFVWSFGSLPPAANVGGNVGFVPYLANVSGVATSLFVQSFEMIAAPSELMTL